MRTIGILVAVLAAVIAVPSRGAERSCRDTAGAARAAVLVRECKAISEETHPPCNANNPCAMMVSDITYWCGINRTSHANLQPFCAKYH